VGSDGLEENIQLLLSQVFWKGLGRPEAIAFFDRVDDRYLLLSDQVMVELSDPLEVAVDGLCLEPSPDKEVDIVRDRPGSDLLKGSVQPKDEVPKARQIVCYRKRRVVPSLQVSPVVDYQLGTFHRFLLFL